MCYHCLVSSFSSKVNQQEDRNSHNNHNSKRISVSSMSSSGGSVAVLAPFSLLGWLSMVWSAPQSVFSYLDLDANNGMDDSVSDDWIEF